MKKEKHVVISKGNIKMGQIQSISLPPIVTCSPLACKFCGKKCYARKICKLRRTVKESYDNNLDILMNDKELFWREVNAAVAMATHFRFGVSGDIPDFDYLLKMVEVAKNNKHCKILCFTKQYGFVNKYLKTKRLPKNLHLIFSAWKGLPMDNPYNLPETHVFYRDGTTTASDGARYCSGNCFECAVANRNCWNLKKGEQIIFKEH